MSGPNRLKSRHIRALRPRGPGWVWLLSLACAWAVLIVVVACTVRRYGSQSDPYQVFDSYTLVASSGPGILVVVGAPLVICLVLAPVLYVKTVRRGHRADRAAPLLAALSCLICLFGLLNAGLIMLPEAVLTVGAVAMAPFPPDPNDPLLRSGSALSRLPPPDEPRLP